MFEVLIVAGCAFLIVMLTARLIRKRRAHDKPRKREQSALDRWMEEQVAQAVAQKLGLERETAMKSLRGEPDPDAVTSMEQGVRGIQVAYERLTRAGEGGTLEAEVRLELSFEDGSATQVRKRVAYTELPEHVREEFDRTGSAHMYRPWHFPWSDPDA